MDKKTRDIKARNARLNILERQISENITEVSYGSLDTELAVGSIIYNISLSANLKGKIPKEERFILSFPDGSNPLIILNKKEDLETTVSTIPVYVDGTDTWEQLIYPSVTYPIGSLISAVNYASNDTNFAAGGNQEVQFNSEGQLGADSDFIYNTSTDTIEAPNATISGTITGDVTGDLTGNADTATALTSGNKTINGNLDVTGNITGDLVDSTSTVSVAQITASGLITGGGGFEGNLSSTSSLDNGVTATTQSVGDDTTKVATTAFVQANSGSATPAGSNTFVQYNNNGSFGADFGMAYNNTTYSLTVANKVKGTLLEGNLTAISLLNDGVTATPQPLNDSSSKVATCSFVQQEITDAAVTPGGPNYSVQFNDSLGGFGGESTFTYSTTSNTLSCANIDSNFSGSYGDIKGKLKGDNIGTGIYATGSAKYWYLTPYDFLGATSGSGVLTSAGNYMMMPSASAFYMVSLQIPVGYKLVKVFIKGNVANSFTVQSSSWSSIFGGSFGSGTINTELTLLTPVNSTEGNYITLSVNPSGSYNRIYGARLTLEEI